jgi:hypothetical protein
MPTVCFEDLRVGSVHLGRKCVCDKDEMLEFNRRNDPHRSLDERFYSLRRRLIGAP